jgi:hypothetical protein
MIGSRQKPLSARIVIFTSGQAARICPTISRSCFSAPAAPSMSAGRSRAQSRWSPQKMYSGR